MNNKLLDLCDYNRTPNLDINLLQMLFNEYKLSNQLVMYIYEMDKYKNTSFNYLCKHPNVTIEMLKIFINETPFIVERHDTMISFKQLCENEFVTVELIKYFMTTTIHAKKDISALIQLCANKMVTIEMIKLFIHDDPKMIYRIGRSYLYNDYRTPFYKLCRNKSPLIKKIIKSIFIMNINMKNIHRNRFKKYNVLSYDFIDIDGTLYNNIFNNNICNNYPNNKKNINNNIKRYIDIHTKYAKSYIHKLYLYLLTRILSFTLCGSSLILEIIKEYYSHQHMYTNINMIIKYYPLLKINTENIHNEKDMEIEFISIIYKQYANNKNVINIDLEQLLIN